MDPAVSFLGQFLGSQPCLLEAKRGLPQFLLVIITVILHLQEEVQRQGLLYFASNVLGRDRKDECVRIAVSATEDISIPAGVPLVLIQTNLSSGSAMLRFLSLRPKFWPCPEGI